MYRYGEIFIGCMLFFNKKHRRLALTTFQGFQNPTIIILDFNEFLGSVHVENFNSSARRQKDAFS